MFILFFVGSVIMNLYLFGMMSMRLEESVYRSGEVTEKIALIDLAGTIDMRTAGLMRRMLKRAEADDDVQGVILVVNCPGGQVAPSNMINRYVQDFQATDKKVYVSIQQLGASGAYWGTVPADKIYAQTNSIVGSIGVIYMSFVAEDGLKNKLGIEPLVIKSSRAEFKDRGPPYRMPTETERAEILEELDRIHERFVAVVSQGRGLTEEETWKLADGDVHDGPGALEKNLIDAVGFLDNVIDDLAEDLGLRDPHVVHYIKPPSLREMLMAKTSAAESFDIQKLLSQWAMSPRIMVLWPGQ